MNRPSPAIVSEAAVRRLPRVPLFLLCLVYVLAGFFGREPWKSADMTALGHMLELVGGSSNWLSPGLFGAPDPQLALLPHWLGALFIQVSPSWLSAATASRIPFVLLLAGTLAATWYATYHLARRPEMQPVNFAFGGEARPKDYARALADAALLAVLACLGLAQLSHETTPALAQLAMGALAFLGMASLPFKPGKATVALLLGLAGLTLSGAPALALLLALINFAYQALDRRVVGRQVVVAALACALVVVLATVLNLWAWRMQSGDVVVNGTRSFLRLVVWFTWPAWPLALWTLWRWRRHLRTFSIGLPLAIAVMLMLSTYLAGGSDRSLLLALPALATLAAFALPTLQRGMSALIDWFTLLFFSGCALIIWIYWVAMETGSPRRMAASVSKLVPGFEPSWHPLPLLVAIAASLLWIALVRWRVGRHPQAIWKSLVLPATGATLCWVLLMTLWLPLLDFARSYEPLVRRVNAVIGQPSCVHAHGLTPGQISAFRYHGQLTLARTTRQAHCPWLLVDIEDRDTLAQAVDMNQWTLRGTFRRPSDKNEDVSLYQRKPD